VKKIHAAVIVSLFLGAAPVFSAQDVACSRLEAMTLINEKKTAQRSIARIPDIESQVCSKSFDETLTQWGSHCAFYAPRGFSEKQRSEQLLSLYNYFSFELRGQFGGDIYGDFDVNHLKGYSIHIHDAYKYLFSNAKVAWELLKVEKKDPCDAVFTRTIIDQKLQDRLNPTLQTLLREMSVGEFF
jgi:hypothetical protein